MSAQRYLRCWGKRGEKGGRKLCSKFVPILGWIFSWFQFLRLRRRCCCSHKLEPYKPNWNKIETHPHCNAPCEAPDWYDWPCIFSIDFSYYVVFFYLSSAMRLNLRYNLIISISFLIVNSLYADYVAWKNRNHFYTYALRHRNTFEFLKRFHSHVNYFQNFLLATIFCNGLRLKCSQRLDFTVI